MTRLMKPPARHLTVDDPVTLTDKYGVDRTFRVRIWQGVGATPVVLAGNRVDPETGLPGPSPGLMTVRLADLVLGSVLGHPSCMMVYFEDQVIGDGSNVLEQVYFEFYGQTHRLKMFRPTRRTIEWARLEHVLEGRIER